jgi:hypothetical protein
MVPVGGISSPPVPPRGAPSPRPLSRPSPPALAPGALRRFRVAVPVRPAPVRARRFLCRGAVVAPLSLHLLFRRPRKDSNLRTRFRKPMLYPLSYGGQ